MMGNTTLLKRVQSEELADYDLKNEKADYQKYSAIDRWLIYKHCHDGFDSDVSKLAIEAQVNLLGEIRCQGKVALQSGSNLKYEFRLPNIILRGDTMTSAKVLLNRYKKIFWPNSTKNDANEIEKVPELSRFIQLQNTVGNQLLVPANGRFGFNTNRAGFGKTDQADIMLFAIYNYYTGRRIAANDHQSTEDVTLKQLLAKDEAVATAQKWLAVFGSWEEFIAQNVLMSFVDSQTGVPRLLWHTHRFRELPRTKQEFTELFQNSNRSIYERGLAIQQRLKRRLV